MKATKARKPRTWFLRTVHSGQVSIEGVIYRPNETHGKYDGRLDGQRFAFAR